MKPQEYKKILEETAVFPREIKDFGIAYCVLGLFDEISELSEKINANDTIENINSEVGDILWYICALCNEIDIEFESVIDVKSDEYIDDVIYNPSKMFGLVKKHYRDGKEINKVFFTNSLKTIVLDLFISCNLNNRELEEILESNYKKLIARRETNTLHGDGDHREKNIEITGI